MLKKFVLGGMVVVAALLGNACGDDASSDSPAGPADGEVTLSSSSDDVIPGNSSSSSVTESPSTSSGQAPQSAEPNESSSSEKAVGGSSSSDEKSSSSSGKVESSSSGKSEKSSSSEGAAGCSSAKVEESSSSAKVDESSSSMKAAESSSSVKVEESSSSEKNEVSSSSEKPAESSSSEKVVESSSSVKPDESSSSIFGSSSSAVENSSSSLEVSGVCKTELEDRCTYGSLYDERDGQTYKTVKIGEQEWMAENLNYEVSIISNTSIWSTCYKGSADSCVIKYGRYYTWTAAIDSISLYTQYSIQCGAGKKCSPSDTVKIKGVCPNGWHLPNQKEWEKLVDFVGVSNAGDVLKSFSDWENWPGIDSYGFSVLPSGVVHNAAFSNRGNKSYLWTATDHDNYSAQCAQFNYSSVRKDVVMFQSERKSAVEALPVRCIKD